MPVRPEEFLTDDVAGELLQEVARRFGRVRVRVRGSSMLPMIRPGDVLVVDPIEIGRLCVGDVILFRWEGRLLAHRVVRLSDDGEPLVITRGDNYAHDDPPVRDWQIIGVASRVIPGGRSIRSWFQSTG